MYLLTQISKYLFIVFLVVFSIKDYNPMPALARGLARAVDFFRSVFRLDPMQGVMMQEMTDQR